MVQKRPTLILGLGNTLLSDDGVGVYAARRALEILADTPREQVSIDVTEAEVAGFALVDLLAGYETAIIIDAFDGPGGSPGEIRIHELERFAPTSHLSSGHQIDLPTAVDLGRRLGLSMPRMVHVVSVTIADASTFSESCTPAVGMAVEAAALKAIELARTGSGRPWRRSGG